MNKKECRVAVMMSTYNGELYIKEQIESIFKQRDVSIDLYIRDDGSSDKTLEIISEQKKIYNSIFILNNDDNENLGPAKSFMTIVNSVGDNYDYYAFSDQDDIWMEDKIISAISLLEIYDIEKPCIYGGSKTILTDSESLNPDYVDISMDFYSTIIRNKVAGCTMVFNKTLKMLINKYFPNYIEMHDIWILKVCQCMDGVCVYDNEPHILYRQHSNNVIGAASSLKVKIKYRLRRKNVSSNTARELLCGYGELIDDIEKKRILEQLTNYKKSISSKFKLIFNKKIKCEKKISTVLFKLGLFINFE